MQYQAVITREGRRTLAAFPDCPGCQTFAEPEEDIYALAREALEGVLESYLAEREVPPRPRLRSRAPRGAKLLAIRLSPALAARVQLRWAREEAGLTQRELAARAGVSQQAIAKLESLNANLTLQTLEEVACALELEVEFALTPPAAA